MISHSSSGTSGLAMMTPSRALSATLCNYGANAMPRPHIVSASYSSSLASPDQPGLQGAGLGGWKQEVGCHGRTEPQRLGAEVGAAGGRRLGRPRPEEAAAGEPDGRA